MLSEKRDQELNRTLRITLRNFNKLHGHPLTNKAKLILQRQLLGNLRSMLIETDWVHVTREQQEDYDEKIRHLRGIISQKNEQIKNLITKNNHGPTI